VAELDERAVAGELLHRPRQVVAREVLRHDVRRKLEQDAAELSRGAKRLERLVEAAEDLRAKLARRPVHPTALVRRRGVPEVGRELLELHRVAGHHPEGLHVHDEAVRGPLRPALRHRPVGEAVVGGVHLHRREMLRVVAQPVLGRLDVLRVPVLRQSLVGPRARADADGGGHVDAMLVAWAGAGA
jgi:hypothetical protein